MRTHSKIIIVAIILLLAGAVDCMIVMTVLGFDFHQLSTVKFVTNTYDIEDDFDSIEIDCRIENIIFVPCKNDKMYVETFASEEESHTVEVESGALIIATNPAAKKWNFDFYIESPVITIYIPEGEYESLALESDTGDITIPDSFSFADINISVDTGDVNISGSSDETIFIKTSTGDITLTDITADEINLKTSTGHINLNNMICKRDITTITSTGELVVNDVTCENLNSNSDTGEFFLNGLIAEGSITIDTDTGDITFDGSDADTLNIKTDTGEVTGTLLSDKIFIVKSDTGDIDVPDTTSGGKCEIETDTGDIKITIK